MKIFFYKSLLIFTIGLIFFEITINAKIKSIKKDIYNLSSKDNLILFKSKIRKQMQDAIEKDDFISDEDAKLIKKFIEKIKIRLDR